MDFFFVFCYTVATIIKKEECAVTQENNRPDPTPRRAVRTPSGPAQRSAQPQRDPQRNGQNAPQRNAQPRPQRTARRPETPSQAPRRALTPEEREERERRLAARRREEEGSFREDEEERRLRAQRSRRLLFIVSLVLALVFTAAYWIFAAVSISGRPAVSGEVYPLLVYTEGKQKEDLSYKAEEVVFRGNTCLPLSCPGRYLSLTLSGNASTRTVLLENGEEATFYLDTDRAVVNGQNVFLGSNSFLKDGELYIPVDFFTDKMNCFSYSYSSAQKSYVLTFDPEASPAFTFRDAPASEPVSASTIPAAPQPEPET